MALTVSDLKSLAAQAACFTCLPVNAQQAIKTYLLAVLSGVSTDPKFLLSQSRSFIGIPSGMQSAIQAYSASVLSGAASASDFVKSQACAFECTPPGMALPISILQLVSRVGLSANPKTLAALACGFTCIPPGQLTALQSFLTAAIAGVLTNPGPLLKKAAPFINTLPGDVDVTTVIWTDVALPAPTGLIITVNPDGSIDVTWNTPGPGIGYTALYLSFACDYTFTFYANIPAPGTTIHIPGIVGLSPGICLQIRSCMAAGVCSPPTTSTGGGGSTPPPPTTDPLVTSWQTRAIANGGAPSAATLACLDTFCKGIRAQTYFTKLKSVNFIAPDDFRCAMTPLIVHAQDSGLWQGLSGGTSTGATTFITGANAVLDASGIRSDLAWTVNPGTNNFNPAAIWSGAGNGGMTVYQTQFDGAHGPFGECMGAQNATDTASVFAAVLYFGNTYMEWLDNASQIAQAHNGKYGYYSWNATAANARNIYFANSTNAHASIAASGVAITGTLNALAFLFNGSNLNGGFGVCSSGHFSFFALHDGLTLAESADFFAKIQALRVCLGTGSI